MKCMEEDDFLLDNMALSEMKDVFEEKKYFFG